MKQHFRTVSLDGRHNGYLGEMPEVRKLPGLLFGGMGKNIFQIVLAISDRL